MFERYTEKARRTIFFARYEASQFGSLQIETEHLLLGLLREDKALMNRLLESPSKLEKLREALTSRGSAGPKIPTSVDLPLSPESKRALAYAAEEGEHSNPRHIGTVHLLFGLVREEQCFAAQQLRQWGVTAEAVRQQVQFSEPARAPRSTISIPGLNQWIEERRAEGTWTVEQRSANDGVTHFIYSYSAHEPQGEGEGGDGQDLAPASRLAQIQKRIETIVKQTELAIAHHEFEKARFYSNEEQKERKNLRQLCEQFDLEVPPPQPPLLCIAVIDDDPFPVLRQRCEAYVREGIAHIWLLDPRSKRAYTVTKADGLHEFQGEVLQIASPRLEMDLRKIFP